MDSLTKQLNKDLVDKYPILIPHSPLTGKIVENYDYSYTNLDAIPKGWRQNFGIQWAAEIQSVIDTLPEDTQKEMYIVQLKEKFGRFKQYFSHYTAELRAVIHKYEVLSEHICINCGEPATYQSVMWISPWCNNCAVKNRMCNIPIKDTDSTVSFKDCFETTFHNNFEIFMKNTKGIMYQYEDNGQLKFFDIQSPVELIPYYLTPVDEVIVDKGLLKIYLGEAPAFQTLLEQTPEGFNTDELTLCKLVVEKYPHFKSVYDLMQQYSNSKIYSKLVA